MGSSDEYCRGSGLVQLLLDAMSSPRPAYCTQQTGGLTWGFTLRAIRTPPDRSRRSIPCQIDGSVPHPARPPTLRASRYRTFSHGWAFRPNAGEHPRLLVRQPRLIALLDLLTDGGDEHLLPHRHPGVVFGSLQQLLKRRSRFALRHRPAPRASLATWRAAVLY